MAFFVFKRFTKLTAPVRKLPLMHPDNAPLTISKIPEAFYRFRYAGPTIDLIDDAAGHRRPALVALMILQNDASPDDAVVSEEMTVSLRDLQTGMHPQHLSIARELRGYYETHVPQDQQESSARMRSLSKQIFDQSATA